jgi:hypothetical protein
VKICAPYKSIYENNEKPKEANHAERFEAGEERSGVGLEHAREAEEFEHTDHAEDHDEVRLREADEKDDEVEAVPVRVEVPPWGKPARRE